MTPRFGVIGSAYWAREVHLPGLIEAGLHVAGLWARDAGRTRAIAETHGVASFARFEDLLDAVDVVTLAVPPSVQAGLALTAARAGKHLLLEKPVALDLPAASAILAAVRERDLATIVFFLRRFIPEVEAAIAAETGRPWHEADVSVRSSALAGAGPYFDSAWRHEPGAALWDIGPHVLSVLIPLLGPVTAVAAEPGRDGAIALRTSHAGGATARSTVTLHAPAGTAGNTYRLVAAGRDVTLPDPVFSRTAAFGRAALALAEEIRTGRRDHPCGLPLGVETVRVLADAARSAGLARGTTPSGAVA